MPTADGIICRASLSAYPSGSLRSRRLIATRPLGPQKRAAVAHAEVKTRPIAASAGNTTNDLDLHPVMIKKEPPESSKERPVANLATVVDGESGQPANAAVGASAVVKPANHDDVIDIDALPTPAGLEGAGKIIDLDAPEVRADGGAPNTAHAMKDGKPASEGPQQKGIDMTASLEQGQGSDVVPGADGDGFDPSQFMAGFDPSILGASDSGLNSAMLDPQDAGPGLGVPSFDGTASWTMPAPIQAPGDPPGPSAAQGDPALASAADAQGGSTMPPDFAGMDMDQFAELMKTLPADADPAAGVGAGDGVEAGTGDMGDLPGFDASAMLGMGQVDWEGIDLDSMLGSYFQADGGEGGAQ